MIDDTSTFSTWDGEMVNASVCFSVDGNVVSTAVLPSTQQNTVNGDDKKTSPKIQLHHLSATLLAIPASSDLYPTISLHSSNTKVLGRFCSADLVEKDKRVLGRMIQSLERMSGNAGGLGSSAGPGSASKASSVPTDGEWGNDDDGLEEINWSSPECPIVYGVDGSILFEEEEFDSEQETTSPSGSGSEGGSDEVEGGGGLEVTILSSATEGSEKKVRKVVSVEPIQSIQSTATTEATTTTTTGSGEGVVK
jgi:hypothetical protein